MSYSRWSHSCWYTFHSAREVNNEPTLEVQCEECWPLSKLKNEKESVLNFYRNARWDRNPRNYQGKGKPPKDRYVENEIQELSDIIDEFIKDNNVKRI